MAQGKKTWGKKAVRKAMDIIENHKPQALPDDVQKSLDQIRARALETLKDEHIEA